jgi:hypothetical protein
MEPTLFAFYIILGLALTKVTILLILCKGNLNNLGHAIGTFFSVLVQGKLPTIEKNIGIIKSEPKINADLIWPLYLLQREARLIDFLLEDISSAPDDLVGAGVRDVHGKCRKYLLEKFTIEPIISKEEGARVTLEEGFNPSKIMLTGFLEGLPPYNGILKHQGWEVLSSHMPEVPESFRKNPVLAQAELEIPQK